MVKLAFNTLIFRWCELIFSALNFSWFKLVFHTLNLDGLKWSSDGLKLVFDATMS